MYTQLGWHTRVVWHILIAVYTVLVSWWWTENLYVTCRVLFQKEIWEISASLRFYYKSVKSMLILEEALWENSLNIVNDAPTIHVNFITNVFKICEKMGGTKFLSPLVKLFYFISFYFQHVFYKIVALFCASLIVYYLKDLVACTTVI